MTRRGLIGTILAMLVLGGRAKAAATGTAQVPFEDQMSALAAAGLVLNPVITVEDVLFSFTRTQYENNPFALLLFTFSVEVEREPWGRRFCDRAFAYDMESVSGPDSYADALQGFAAMAGVADGLRDLAAGTDADGAFRLRYTLGQTARDLRAEPQDDWADPDVIAQIIADVTAAMPAGTGIWQADNGQQQLYFRLGDAGAAAINARRPAVLMRAS